MYRKQAPFSVKRVKNIFGENITTRTGTPRKMPEVIFPRWIFLASILILVFLFGTARLIDLQIIRGEYFHELAEGNRIRRIPLKSPRGEILDRNGVPLAQNTPVYKLATFSQGGVVSETQIISREEALEIQAKDAERATQILIETKREYPLGAAAAHVVGYVNEINKDELNEEPDNCPQITQYQLGDLRGRMGVESEFDCILRGVNGEELIEVDTRGRLVRRLGRRDPVAGQSIQLTIDSKLQEKAYEALVNAPNEEGTGKVKDEGGVVRGAFVAQNPESGEVLALISTPSFNSNDITALYAVWATDKNLPLFNRAITGTYPPGSTFKLVSATAGLEEGKIDKNYQYEDKGIITVNDFSYRNWYFTQYGGTEGVINIVRALARSTDTFFYKLGEMVHVSGLVFWAEKFGLGEKTNIDLPGEAKGLVPNPEWKLETKGERWFLGNTYHLSIGQGDLLTTPLQVNRMTSAIASDGNLCAPHVSTSYQSQVTSCETIDVSQSTIDIITEGMLAACAEDGTAFPFFNFEPRVACKTGTSQFDGSDKTHAWFTAFVPEADLSATVLIEEGGEGSRVAAPVIREIFDSWLNQN